MNHEVTFRKSGRGKAQCPPDPDYPNGKKIAIDVQPNCEVSLPYPAPECGQFFVKCKACEAFIIVTAAGRPDDPISVTVPCRKEALN